MTAAISGFVNTDYNVTERVGTGFVKGLYDPKNGRSTLYGLFSSEQRQTQDPMFSILFC